MVTRTRLRLALLPSQESSSSLSPESGGDSRSRRTVSEDAAVRSVTAITHGLPDEHSDLEEGQVASDADSFFMPRRPK